MLIPRERPYLEGLNSYYLQLEKFIEHLQGEIGSGGVHCAGDVHVAQQGLNARRLRHSQEHRYKNQ